MFQPRQPLLVTAVSSPKPVLGYVDVRLFERQTRRTANGLKTARASKGT